MVVVVTSLLLGEAQAAELTNSTSLFPTPLTLEATDHTQMGGLLFQFEKTASETKWSLAPLLSYIHDTATDFTEFDLLYPLLTYDRFGAERRLQLFQIFSLAGTEGLAGENRKRLTLFPIFFQQRSSNPAANYTAILPFYGHLHNRLLRDEVRFVLFPLYLESRKRDVITDNYLFPFFHLRQGEKLNGWQLWPLAGFEHKDVTTRTNLADEVETIGGHEKLFVLWPFFFKNKLGLGTDNPQTQDVLLPFFSRQHSPLRDSSTYFWPFGLTVTDDREKKYREWGAPWPLVTFARGEGKTANRVWPLFGRAKNPILESDFYLWPLYKYNRATAEPLDRERTRILFFLYSDLTEKNTATGTSFRRTDLWPLFTARRDHRGVESRQILSLLEPLIPNNKSVERNYSPVWALWRSEKDPRTGQSSQILLWNLYRRETMATAKKCSLLFGLFHYQSGPQGKRWRLFNWPARKAPSPAPAPAKP